MKLQLRAHHLTLSPAAQQAATQRLTAALDRHTAHLSGVDVTFEDHNGPKGGAAISAKAIAHLRAGGTLVAEATSTDVGGAASTLADKLAAVVEHHLGRHARGHSDRQRISASGKRTGDVSL